MEDQLNKDFNLLFDWFEDNKLSIQLVDDKNKQYIILEKEQKGIHQNQTGG